MMAKGPRCSRQHDCFLEVGGGGEGGAPCITWCGMMKAINTSHTRPLSWFLGLFIFFPGVSPLRPHDVTVMVVDTGYGWW